MTRHTYHPANHRLVKDAVLLTLACITLVGGLLSHQITWLMVG